MNRQVIKKPLVTEKSSALAESSVYTFEVDRKATKVEVKTAVEEFFNVKVKSVKTLVCRGRSKRSARGMTKVKYWKKAYVTLGKGETLSLFEGA